MSLQLHETNTEEAIEQVHCIKAHTATLSMCIRRCPLSTVVNQDLLIWRRDALEDTRPNDCANFLLRYAAALYDDTVQRLSQADDS